MYDTYKIARNYNSFTIPKTSLSLFLLRAVFYLFYFLYTLFKIVQACLFCLIKADVSPLYHTFRYSSPSFSLKLQTPALMVIV